MKLTDRVRPASPITARELLVFAAGVEHATHSVSAVFSDSPRGRIAFKCGGRWPEECGAMCFVLDTAINRAALRNMPVEKLP